MASIPDKWQLLLLSKPSPEVITYLDIPRKCGLLSAEELEITEKYDATALAEAIRLKRLKSIDVVRAFCRRAAIANQLTNCWTEILFKDAIIRASELDSHLAARKPPLGSLHGVPGSLKDTFRIKGYDTSIDIAALAFKPAQENPTLVDILLNAGAVLYCKTNVPQTLMAIDSHNNIFGRTLNPYNTSVTAGRSSGGEGALLALRGSVLGVGTDVGGSIRIPVIWQRIPYAGQENGTLPAASKLGIPASARPLAHSIRDIELFFKAVSEQKPWELDPDAIPSPWKAISSSSPNEGLRIGIVKRDGATEPHPPILRLLDEVGARMTDNGIKVIDMDITAVFPQCQSLANALFGIEGGNAMLDLLESTKEPLPPWLSTRMRRKALLSLDKVCELHARRTELQRRFLDLWKDKGGRKIDAFTCPVAPHPVPPIDRWNGVGYTSSFVLMDYSAGVFPVRVFEERDMEGDFPSSKPLSSWDKANRGLWMNLDRSVYVGTPLCVQIVVPKLEKEAVQNYELY
ncbi:general amidase-like protein [Lojkania enalia]|uniref:General amidase-like protein n=1 Tax=Lojkania enalia TaxID=147567 RepID=A0A9P4K1U9_9PLEO|nr:general amidase-like protein [Didymosphaeria enalia]